MRLGSLLSWLIPLGIALFIGLMIASAGTAFYPPVTAIATPLICPGEVVHESHGASYRPGEYTVTREIYCVTGGGKGAREDITLKAIGVAFLLYSAIAFLLLRFLLWPLLRRRYERAFSARAGPAPVDLHTLLARVSEAAGQGEAKVVVRDFPGAPPDRDDLGERLLQLKALHERGLISDADYEAKKAQILSRL